MLLDYVEGEKCEITHMCAYYFRKKEKTREESESVCRQGLGGNEMEGLGEEVRTF